MAIQDNFKDALASWASGVTVVSSRSEDGKMYGLTASSFSSLSLYPPLVLVCLANTNRMPSLMQQSRRFAVSILSREQEAVSNHFAKPGREPTMEFDEKYGMWTKNDMPVLKNSAAYLACDVHELIVQGDHTIAIGKVIEAVADASKKPLLYYRRAYHSISE